MSEEKKMQAEESAKNTDAQEDMGAKQKETQENADKKQLSPTWAQECIEDIDDWIESQGIYLRQ